MIRELSSQKDEKQSGVKEGVRKRNNGEVPAVRTSTLRFCVER